MVRASARSGRRTPGREWSLLLTARPDHEGSEDSSCVRPAAITVVLTSSNASTCRTATHRSASVAKRCAVSLLSFQLESLADLHSHS